MLVPSPPNLAPDQFSSQRRALAAPRPTGSHWRPWLLGLGQSGKEVPGPFWAPSGVLASDAQVSDPPGFRFLSVALIYIVPLKVSEGPLLESLGTSNKLPGHGASLHNTSCLERRSALSAFSLVWSTHGVRGSLFIASGYDVLGRRNYRDCFYMMINLACSS